MANPVDLNSRSESEFNSASSSQVPPLYDETSIDDDQREIEL